MNLQSMTGFGRGEAESDQYRIVVELKSVNHRFKEFRFRMPSFLNKMEHEFKNLLSNEFKRGTIDVSINLKKSQTDHGMKALNFEKINSFLADFQSQVNWKLAKLDPTVFLRNEFYVDLEDQEDQLVELTKQSLDMAIRELKKSRLSEGTKLNEVFANHLKSYISYFEHIKQAADKFRPMVEERLRERFKQYQQELNVDESRFLQEIVFYLEKIDVHEEINRIEAHLKKLNEILSSRDELGRELDFTIQELNRETNTIGSKSTNVEISEHVVKMKVELEKMREQGLNLQ